MSSKFNVSAVMLYTLYCVSPMGENIEQDFLPNERETANKVGQECADRGYRAVRLAAVCYNNRRKQKHSLDIVQRFQKARQMTRAA